MNLLKELTKKNLQMNKKRTIVTIIGIILSVALITAVASMFLSAYKSLIEYEKKTQGNYHYSFLDVEEKDISSFTKNKKIESLSVIEKIGYAKLDQIKNEYKPYVYIKGYTKEAFSNLDVNLIEGNLPQNENEILISEHINYNGKCDLKIGDELTLDIGKRVSNGKEFSQYIPFDKEVSEEIIETEKKTYKIVGIITRPPLGMEPYTAPGYTLITLATKKNESSIYDIYVRYTKKGLKNDFETTANILEVDEKVYDKINNYDFNLSEEEYQKIQDAMSNAKYQYSKNNYLISLEKGQTSNSAITALSTAAIIVIIIIIITSIFCIKNGFDISLTEKIKQYGMLSSIGATRKQIKSNIYYEALLLGTIGIPLGLIFGHLASYILILITNTFIKDMLGFKIYFEFSSLAIIFSVVLSYITILLSARSSAKRASKITPITAIKNSEEFSSNKKKQKQHKLSQKLFGIGGLIAQKNLERSKKKYRTTVISIAVCATVFIALSSFVNIAFDIIKSEYESGNYDIGISYYKSENEHIDDQIKELYKLKDIKDISHIKILHLTIDTKKKDYTNEYLKLNPYYKEIFKQNKTTEESIMLAILDEKTYQKYCKSLGLDYNKVKEKALLKNRIYEHHGIDNAKVEVDKYAFKENSSISGIINKYSTDTPPKEANFSIEIAQMVEEVPLGIEINSSNNYLMVNEKYLKDIPPTNTIETIYIKTNDYNKILTSIDEIFKENRIYLSKVSADLKMMNSFVTLVGIFLYGFITVIALIGITNIFNTITTNMNLRRREFAMLKSIGMTKKEFNHMIYLESIFYCGKALIFSIPVGILISYIIYKVMTNGSVILKYEVPLSAIIVTIIIVFILIYIIMKYSINKINKQNTIETIRNENI